jgi:predicted lipoprotein with Yx(FWY)xxD motif
MPSRLVFTGGLVAVAFLAAACSTTGRSTGAYGAPNPPASAAPSAAPVAAPPVASPAPPAAAGAAINVGTTQLGQVLVDANGQTVYLFVADKGTASSCNSASCVQYWPPVLTNGAPQAGAGVNASLLGTTTRADGTSQVTYAGHPLYLFTADKKAGDATGQGVSAFGAPWYVVSPSGMQIG